MNKTVATISILIAGFLSFPPNSSASLAGYTEVNDFDNFEEYKIVGSFGSTVEKTVFDINDPSPYLYMKLPVEGVSFTGSFWRDPDAATFYKSTIGTAQDRWITLSDWAGIKKVGQWEVNSNFFYTNGDAGFATASFTVTPEPMAMALFLIGGAPIAVNLYRKKKHAITG